MQRNGSIFYLFATSLSISAFIFMGFVFGYAYGDPGNEKERLKVDRIFQNELLSAGASEFAAKAMFEAVRAGGIEELCLSFSWSFARVEPCEPGL